MKKFSHKFSYKHYDKTRIKASVFSDTIGGI